MEKCRNHQLEDYPFFGDDQNHDSNQDQVHDVENIFVFVEKERALEEEDSARGRERERRLRDMPTRYV